MKSRNKDNEKETGKKKRKYVLKVDREKFVESRSRAGKAAHPKTPLPKHHTIRVREPIFQEMKTIKGDCPSWDKFFIARLGLKSMKLDRARY